MKYSLQIDIECPRAKLLALFDEPQNLTRWQADLLAYELIEGEQGQVGARSRLSYKIGKKEFEMTETVIERNPPEEFRLEYQAKGVWNGVRNRFTEIDPQNTRWQVETEFRCRGLMWFISIVMPGMFKTQTQNYMRQFKAFAESEAGGGVD